VADTKQVVSRILGHTPFDTVQHPLAHATAVGVFVVRIVISIIILITKAVVNILGGPSPPGFAVEIRRALQDFFHRKQLRDPVYFIWVLQICHDIVVFLSKAVCNAHAVHHTTFTL
jgi:hypothetical protein